MEGCNTGFEVRELSMIEKLALNHNTWVEMALSICRDPFTADDLVSEMYLKLANKQEEINKWYVYSTLRSIFIDQYHDNNKRKASEKSYFDLNSDNRPDFENFDEVAKEYKIRDCISWKEEQILLHRQTKSCRDIHKQYQIHYLKVHRIEKEAKKKLEEWAKKLKE